MTEYAVKELPNIDDPDLIQCCVWVQQMRSVVSAFMQHIISQLGQRPVTTPVRVALAIMDRVAEGSLSIELLCMKSCVRDAAIILLSLHELALDLQYIALDLSRASSWIAHVEQGRKPWRVKSEQCAIYTAQNELDAEISLYRTYSMIKHGNPAGGTVAFGIAATRDGFLLNPSNGNHAMVRTHLFGLGTRVCQVSESAAIIWTNEGFDVGRFPATLRETWKLLSKHSEKQILATLKKIAATAAQDE